MPALTELKGSELGTQRVVIERGPVRVFAAAVKDADPSYREDVALVPATYPFVMAYWGAIGPGGQTGLPIDKLRGRGRMILHGEQEFMYHRWPRVGDVLEGSGRVADVFEKERPDGSGMEFYVTETDWRDAKSGEAVVTTRFTLIVTYRPTA
jgi:N-terminal half of MaoC dehydratase